MNAPASRDRQRANKREARLTAVVIPDFVSIFQAFTVAEYTSISRAARVLRVRQSAVSRRVLALEDELGVSLFERHREGVRLTDAGRRFFKKTGAAFAEIESAVKNAAAAGRGTEGVIRIGIVSASISGFLSDLLKEFRTEHAAVWLDFSEGSSRAHIAKIIERSLDVAFVVGSQFAPDCETLPVWRSRICVALPEQHILGVCENVDWTYLREERFIFGHDADSRELYELVIARFDEIDRRPEIENYGVCRETLMHLVALGFGISLISESNATQRYPGVILRPLAGEEKQLLYSAIWLPENDNPAARRFLSLARSKVAGRQSPLEMKVSS